MELCCLNGWFIETFAKLCQCEKKRKNEKEDDVCFNNKNGLEIYIVGELHHSTENLDRLINLAISNKINLFYETTYISQEAEKFSNTVNDYKNKLMRNGTIFGLENEFVKAFINFDKISSKQQMEYWITLRDNKNFKLKMENLESKLRDDPTVPKKLKLRLKLLTQYNLEKEPAWATSFVSYLVKDIENAILEVIQEDEVINKLMVHAYGENYADNIPKMKKDFALGRVRDLTFFSNFLHIYNANKNNDHPHLPIF